MYHRIAETTVDPWGLNVSPQHFAEHLDVLRSYRVVQLPVMARVEHRAPARKAVAITFDDGYADALDAACPLLERFNTPATFFLTTGGLGQQNNFWWDELERILLHPRSLPERLEITLQGRAYSWDLGHAADWSHAEFLKQHAWKAWNDPPTVRHEIYFQIWVILRKLAEPERKNVLDELRNWANASVSNHDSDIRLNIEQIGQLRKRKLVEIGAHSVTHPLLSSLTPSIQRQEVEQSRTDLQEITGQPIESFAFPYGDYTTETISVLREAGFKQACSTARRPVQRGCSRFELPRLQVMDCDGEAFARHLQKWFSS
jgi:peptidoglycan/xylan/chitin deacetylase (PgdA/CDA1 family)